MDGSCQNFLNLCVLVEREEPIFLNTDTGISKSLIIIKLLVICDLRPLRLWEHEKIFLLNVEADRCAHRTHK